MRSDWAKRDTHDEYERLIAFYSTGELTDSEMRELTAHLRVCGSCREGLGEYRAIFRYVGAAQSSRENALPESHHSWAPELKKKVLNNFASMRATTSSAPDRRSDYRQPTGAGLFTSTSIKNATIGAVCVFLVAAGVLLAKRNNRLRNTDPIFTVTSAAKTDSPADPRAAGAIEEAARLKRELQDRNQLISSLEKQIKEQESEIAEFKNQLSLLKNEREGELSERDQAKAANSVLAQQQQDLTNKLHDQEASLGAAQQQLRDLQSEHAADLAESAHQEGEIAGLRAQLNERDATIEQQQQLLASDRDIRELMGARELTIAEISDFDQNAQKRKPFGRVFFTKDKSLVFYAFDLDKQKELRNASSFQAWGVDSSNRNAAVNLGILYKDSESNRRWTLKFDDPEILAKINAIFVTVEPSGGSRKPSGKQLLYAYLRTQPNHP